MLIAKIDNPVPVDYRVAFPNVSFPDNGPDDEFLSENGYAKVNLFKEHDRKTQKLVSVEPYYEKTWVYTVEVQDKTEEDLAAETESQWASIRQQRNVKLAESDWTQIADAPFTEEKRLEWVTYRQALRDITNQTDPFSISWPTDPNFIPKPEL